MTAIWALTAQAIMAFLGYCAALFSAATFATIAILNLGPATFSSRAEEMVQVVVLIFSLMMSVLPASLVPAGVAIALTEGLKLRGLVAYLVIGAIVGLVMALPVASVIAGDPLPAIDSEDVTLSVASAAVGGFVYWAVAGRTAGRWLELPWFERNRR